MNKTVHPLDSRGKLEGDWLYAGTGTGTTGITLCQHFRGGRFTAKRIGPFISQKAEEQKRYGWQVKRDSKCYAEV